MQAEPKSRILHRWALTVCLLTPWWLLLLPDRIPVPQNPTIWSLPKTKGASKGKSWPVPKAALPSSCEQFSFACSLFWQRRASLSRRQLLFAMQWSCFSLSIFRCALFLSVSAVGLLAEPTIYAAAFSFSHGVGVGMSCVC